MKVAIDFFEKITIIHVCKGYVTNVVKRLHVPIRIM